MIRTASAERRPEAIGSAGREARRAGLARRTLVLGASAAALLALSGSALGVGVSSVAPSQSGPGGGDFVISGGAAWTSTEPAKCDVHFALAGTGADPIDSTKCIVGSWTAPANRYVTATMPAASSGWALPVNVDVVVDLGETNAYAVGTGKLSYWPTPQLTAPIAPSIGPQDGGNTVILTGTGFGALGGTAGVTCAGVSFTFGGQNQNPISCVVSAASISAVTPVFAAAGSQSVTVTGRGGTSNSLTYEVFPRPVITAVSPLQGYVMGGTPITITGSALSTATDVSIGGTSAAFTAVSDAEIRTTAPPHAAGSVALQVTSPGGTASGAFSYLLPPAPLIATVTPGASPLAGGTTVTVAGEDLLGADAVTFGGVAATSFEVISNTKITAVSPARTSAGSVSLRVRTPGGADAVPFAYSDSASRAARPIVTRRTRLRGVPRVGQTMRCTRAAATGATSSSLVWLLKGNVIRKATRASYRVRRADVGKRLTCVTRLTGLGGTISSAAPSVRIRR